MPFWAEIVIISFTAFVTALIFTVIFLYALFFPFLNRMFGLTLPTFDFSDFKKEEKKPESTSRTQTVFKRTQTTNPQVRYTNLHKDVPTIRLPPTDNTCKEQTLTAGKIDAAVRSTKMAANAEKQIQEKSAPAKSAPKAPAAAPAQVKPVEPKKADKKQKDEVVTFEIPVAPAPAEQQKIQKPALTPRAAAPIKIETAKPAAVKSEPAAKTETVKPPSARGATKTARAEEPKAAAVKPPQNITAPKSAPKAEPTAVTPKKTTAGQKQKEQSKDEKKS